MITSIVLEKNRFKVFATIDGNDVSCIFMPEVTASDILAWLKEQQDYYTGLKLKEKELQDQLVQDAVDVIKGIPEEDAKILVEELQQSFKE